MNLFSALTSLLLLASSGTAQAPDWSELRPVLMKLQLPVTQDPGRGQTRALEEADAQGYAPVWGVTLFLKKAPASGDGGIRPRYWMRVEDYATAQAAAKRAAEYFSPGTYRRLARLPIHEGTADKTTVRLWAVARGRRVYALTTDAAMFTSGRLPADLKKALERLPEK